MLTHDPMTCYESLERASRRMLEAARNSEWNLLLTLELECRELIDQLPFGEDSPQLGIQQHQRRREIINRILIEDAEIRDISAPWMARAKQFLTSLTLERKMNQDRHHPAS
jgi:flagellar protein FliT